MEGKVTKLFKSTTKNAVAQLLAAGICTAVLFLFAALTYSRITLPRYTTQYDQKDTQQVINLIVTVVAVVIGILLSHCRRLTNEAETKSELRDGELTIPRLHVHFEAAGGSKASMGLPAFHNRQIWSLVAFYLFAMIMFGFLNSVLSVIFVIEAVISDKGEQVPAYIPISIDIPEEYKGKTVDPCVKRFSRPGCAYAYATTSLSSQLVIYSPYTVAGVRFEPPNGTMGLPYYAMEHFRNEVSSSIFDEERRQYCLPVMDPHIIKCHEEPFNQYRSETISSLVRYKALNVSEVNYSGPPNDTTATLVSLYGLGTYKIVVDYPSVQTENIRYRTNDQAQGTMMVMMLLDNDPPDTSVIATSNNGKTGYASLLYEMMYGHPRDLSNLADLGVDSFYFVAKCKFASIKYRDNYLSSWRKVDFTLKNGVASANVTEERCPNPRGSGTSGFDDLYYALEGASSILGSSDGYSNIFNMYRQLGHGSPIFANMSRLDATVNQILHIMQTSWTRSSHKYAMKNQTVYDKPIIMTSYPHLYVVRISWTPATYIGLVLSLLITLNAWALAGRWARATYRFGFGAETWNLLRPVELMGYSLAAYQDLIHDLNTVEHRRAVLRGKTHSFLREWPVWEGTQSLIGLVSNNAKPSPDSTGVTNSPVSTSGGNFGSPAEAGGGPSVTVEKREQDLEKGN